jgi:ABC-type transport system involved in Fe-S cluster assembly fused permease/ATPase subunit
MFLLGINRLLWLDVSLYRTQKLKIEAYSKIIGLDAYFHSVVHPTDVIKAVNYAGSVDKLLDTFIFHFAPNLVTLVFTLGSLFQRYRPFMIIIMIYMTTSYYTIEKRSVIVRTRERDKYISIKNNLERRRRDGVHGWSTVFNHNRVKYETNLFESEVGFWIRQ